MIYEVYACSDQGRVRGNNEDNFYVSGKYRENITVPRIELESNFEPERLLFAVCDGMGGEEDGELASLAAVKALISDPALSTYKEAEINAAAANAAVKAVRDKLESRRTGTTLAAFAIDGANGLAYNLGDSRVYLHRNGKLKKLTRDHTLAAYLVELGMLAEEQAETHPNKNSLTQYIGMECEGEVRPYFADEVHLIAGDRILLCSDGLYDMVDNATIEKIIGKDCGTAETGKTLIETALASGGIDNVTAVLISVR